jgi:hypothetical protein
MHKAMRHISDFRKTNVGFKKRQPDEFDSAEIYFKGNNVKHPKSPVFKAGEKHADLFATSK